MELKVRWMRRDDMRRVCSIRKRCGMDPDLLERMLCDSFSICKVAECDGKVSGFMAYRNGRRKMRLLELVVHPSFRRRGVALSLMESMSARMNFDPKRLEAVVSEYNLPAQMLLKRAGLRATEIISSPSGSDYRFVMTLKATEKSVDSSGKLPKVVEN